MNRANATPIGVDAAVLAEEREYDGRIVPATGCVRFAMSTNKTPSTPTTKRVLIDNFNVDGDAELAAFDKQVIADSHRILQRKPSRSRGHDRSLRLCQSGEVSTRLAHRNTGSLYGRRTV